MYQHTIPTTKDEGKDDHSGHSESHWTTQPSTGTISRSRGFFARMTKRNRQSSESATSLSVPLKPCRTPEEAAAKPGLGARSPSLPSIREAMRREELEKMSLFNSPPKSTVKTLDIQLSHERLLRRSPSLPCIMSSSKKQHQSSPMAHTLSHRGMTPSAVSQANNYNKSVKGMTPMQCIKSNIPYSASRPPLQSITPLNHNDLGSTMSNRKMINGMDKENMMYKLMNDEAPAQMKLEFPLGKEPTPEWKKNIMLQMMDSSPVGMSSDNFSMKRPSQPADCSANKAARNLFALDGPFSVPSDPVEILNNFSQGSNESEMHGKMHMQLCQQFNYTPVPTKKLNQRSQSFEFKQPNLPMQKPKEAAQNDMIVVNTIPYRKGDKLGKGGSSDVFQVFRMSDDAEFALKIVHLKDADESVRKGFLNEISFLERMQGCERVIQLIDFEFCQQRELLFVIMERGVRDLSVFLKDRAKRKDLRISTVEAFWRDMVEAVAAIHCHGIIHSDLKPANFILCGEVGFHQLKIIDFGIASSVQTDMTSVIKEHPAGTLNYMSPEALQGINVKINFKSDIWSLGCILYCLLYGCTPFQHIKNYSMKSAAISDPNHVINFPPKSQSLPGDGLVPPRLLDTLQSCLSYRPEDRPSAKELLDIKYCGCEQLRQHPPTVDTLAQGLASLVNEHRLGGQLGPLLIAALQKVGQH